MYRADQWKVIEFLGQDAPKRATFKTSDIVDGAFKRRDNADRVVRNAFRKPRKEGHVEISERGEYRLTAKGVKWYEQAKKEGFKPAPARASSGGKKKASAKKASAKKASAKKKKKTTKKAPTKKRASAKKANGAKKAAPKKSAKTTSNGVKKTKRRASSATAATLSF